MCLRIVAVVIGMILVAVVLWDGFETIILPRHVTRKLRLTRLFYHYTWIVWSKTIYLFSSKRRVETYLSFYGPLSLLFLLVVWAAVMIFGFGLIHWAAGSIQGFSSPVRGVIDNLYFSGTTFFTLGLGDLSPSHQMGRFLTMLEAGLGFGFLALVVGYLPALNQSFSHRETVISLLDARAGSPPTAMEMLRRHSHHNGLEELRQLLARFEEWASALLESHLSYPVLAYFRSQHDNQSWLSALAAVLDASCLIMTGLEGPCRHQALLTFAMARHAVVDLSIVFNAPPWEPKHGNRLPPADLEKLRAALAEEGFYLQQGTDVDQKLLELRDMYEPYLYGLAELLCFDLPPWMPDTTHVDNWKTSAWNAIEVVDEKGQKGERKRHHF